jgi:metal iron transporter
MTVAIVMGRSGIDTLLVASQVVLSAVHHLPLIYCTPSKIIMSVRKPRSVDTTLNPDIVEVDDEMVDFSSGWVATAIGATIWLVVVAANLYVIVSLAMGNEG